MSLRSKIVLVLVPVVAGYAVIDHGLQRLILRPSFDSLEVEHAERDMQRVQAAIGDELAVLSERAESWAERPDLAAFARGEDPDYAARQLGELVFQNEGLNLLFVLDSAGDVQWGEVRRGPGTDLLRLREFPSGRFAATHRLVNSERPMQPIAGLWNTDEGPLLVAAHPILDRPDAGDVHGRLILGRFLPGTTLERIAERTKVPFDFWPLDGSPLPADVEPMVDDATASAEPVVRAVDGRSLHVFATMADARNQPALLLRAQLPRDISAQGGTAILYALLSTCAAGLLMVLVLLNVLQRVVLKPLARLTDQAVAIGQRDDSSLRLGLVRNDEIGTLSNEFDAMLGKLDDSRAAVVTAARSAGMSEIATGILHNVGNVLNSVCVSTGMLDEKLRQSRIGHLEKLAALLEEHRENLAQFVAEDPKGKQVVPFLTALTRQLADERGGLQAELGQLMEAVEHIRELVASQQAYAGRSTLLESADVGQQIESALRLSEKAQGAQVSVDIERDLAEMPRVPLDKHKLVEILVNLVQNARQSLAEARPEHPKIVVQSRLDDGLLTIRVVDNGVGIPEENLTKVFHHGFTTKANGHGFGLHASANAATELGGKLTVHSEGPGKGAEFTLTIPTAQQPLAKAS